MNLDQSGVTFDAAMREAEQSHCLRLVAAGSGWDAYVLEKARGLERKRAYRGLTAAVEVAISDAGRKLPPPWNEPSGIEVFQIPPNYRLFVPAVKGVRA